MKLTQKEIMKILNKEIEWCNNHPKEVSVEEGIQINDEWQSMRKEEWTNGFIAGLYQAKYLIKKIYKRLQP